MAHPAKHTAFAVTMIAALTLASGSVAFAAPGSAQQNGDNTRWDHMSAARTQAIHECSVMADKFYNYTWGDTESDHYRACMAQHGQQE
jgi:hypothetical protein